MTGSRTILLVTFAGAAGSQLAGLSAGWWPATLVTGLIAGVLVRGVGPVLAAALATVGSWTALMWGQSGGRAAEVAEVVAAMATGAPGAGWLVLVATYGYALGSLLAGWWLGAATRRAWRAATARPRRNAARATTPAEPSPAPAPGSQADAVTPVS